MSTLLVILLCGLPVAVLTLFVLAACAAGARADRQMGIDVEGDPSLGQPTENSKSLQTGETQPTSSATISNSELGLQSGPAVPRLSSAPGDRRRFRLGRRDTATQAK